MLRRRTVRQFSSRPVPLYTVDAVAGVISIFAVQDDGSLVNLGQQDGLPASAGLNGIAAY
jgi:hypothetical protein